MNSLNAIEETARHKLDEINEMEERTQRLREKTYMPSIVHRSSIDWEKRIEEGKLRRKRSS